MEKSKDINRKNYLKDFALGLCSPLLLIPGVLATKLVVEIECELF